MAITLQSGALVRFVVTLAGLAASAPASLLAEPIFAQREGYRCSRCHVNGTGGGMRTDFGAQYAETHLYALAGAPSDAPALGTVGRIDPHLGDYLAVGANLRLANTTALAEKPRNTFESPEANLYVLAALSEQASIYADASIAEGSVEGREAFVRYEQGGVHLKAGHFLLPYGLRLWNDQEFIRENTGFTFAAPDLGFELGVERGPLAVYAALSNGAGGGQDANVFKKLSVLAEATWSHVRVGASSSLNRTRRERAVLGGVHLGATLGRLTLLGEADLIRTTYRQVGATLSSMVGYAEAGLLLARGVQARLAYGYHDPALDVAEDQRMHVRGGLELFLVPGAQLGVFYDLRASVPQDEVGNADLIAAELHAFF